MSWLRIIGHCYCFCFMWLFPEMTDISHKQSGKVCILTVTILTQHGIPACPPPQFYTKGFLECCEVTWTQPIEISRSSTDLNHLLYIWIKNTLHQKCSESTQAKMWKPRYQMSKMFFGMFVLEGPCRTAAFNRRTCTACRSHQKLCSQTSHRTWHFWVHIPVWFYNSPVFCWVA